MSELIGLQRRAPVETLDCGDDAAVWLSRFLLGEQSGIRLGYYREQFRRNIELQYPKYFRDYVNIRLESAGIYTDLTSYHLINEASIDDLNTILENPVVPNNFRPNILVEGQNLEAYSEENWNWIKIEEVVLRYVKPCTRCILTTVDPEAGNLSADREPLKSILRTNNLKQPAHIKCEGKKAVMGILIELWKSGEINVGDEVLVA
ncbi:molybdopterin cofactor sulfurase mosc [Holotrichia oblita]|uniref:Molybdopterin cofactor sulfurase mosc n=1 Tax=Holotrichia oblita TaxID=644536 RepID=A0ACB9SK72_HOLOL|nr:molybdopterin cofactor sulfurase mosc [Holotrichia oblita]